KSFILRRNFNEMANTLKAMFKEVVPLMVYKRVKKIAKRLVSLYVVTNDVAKTVPSRVYSFLQDYMSNNILHVHPTRAASSSIQDLKYQLYLKMKDDEQVYHEDHDDDDAHPEGESSAKRQRTSEYGTYIVGESSFEQVINESNPSGLDDDEVPSKEVSPELLEEISREVDEAQLHKAVNDMLRV
ncbi:hypothetical protein Tco_1528018, partial [Tanacetum coccineum]